MTEPRNTPKVIDPAKIAPAWDLSIMLRGQQVAMLSPLAVGEPRRRWSPLGSIRRCWLRVFRPEKYMAVGVRSELAACVDPAFRALADRLSDGELLVAHSVYSAHVRDYMAELARRSVYGVGEAASTPRHGSFTGGAVGGGAGGGRSGPLSYRVVPGGRLPGVMGGHLVGRARTEHTPVEF